MYHLQQLINQLINHYFHSFIQQIFIEGYHVFCTDTYQDLIYSNEKNTCSLPLGSISLIGRGMSKQTIKIFYQKYYNKNISRKPSRIILYRKGSMVIIHCREDFKKNRLICCLFSIENLAKTISSTLFDQAVDTLRTSLKCELGMADPFHDQRIIPTREK